MTDWSPPSLSRPPEPGGLPAGSGSVGPGPGHPFSTGPRPLDGNRAALLLLVTQNVVTGVLVGWAKLPLGLSLLLSFVATVLLAVVLLRPALGRLVQDARWKTPPAVWTALGALALGVIASRGVLVFVQSVAPQSLGKIEQFQTTGWDRWVLLLAGGLLIPFAEEVAFRGLLLRGYERARGPLFAALASSLLFGLAHGVPAQIAAIFPIAWVLARSVQHSGSFWTGVIVHACNNFFSLLLALLLSGSKLMDQAQAQLKTLNALPLQLGVAGLLVAAAAMFVATLWLKPRSDLAAPVGGPVVSGTLVVLLLLIVVVIASPFLPLAEWVAALRSVRPG